MQQIAKRKKHATSGMADCIESLKIVSAHKGKEAFNRADVGTSPSQSALSSSNSDSLETEKSGEGFFEEIAKLRREREREVVRTSARKGTVSAERDKAA